MRLALLALLLTACDPATPDPAPPAPTLAEQLAGSYSATLLENDTCVPGANQNVMVRLTVNADGTLGLGACPTLPTTADGDELQAQPKDCGEVYPDEYFTESGTVSAESPGVKLTWVESVLHYSEQTTCVATVTGVLAKQ